MCFYYLYNTLIMEILIYLYKKKMKKLIETEML